MAKISHVTVTAPEGRRTPIHPNDGTEPGGGQLYSTAEFVDRVAYSSTTIRAISRGDLVLCDLNGARVPSVELASAPTEIDGGRVRVRVPERKAK